MAKVPGHQEKRTVDGAGHPREEKHVYPFSRILKCHRCGSPYHGEATYYHGNTDLRMTHERRTIGKECGNKPKSRSIDSLSHEFCDRVVSQIYLEEGWKSLLLSALYDEQETKNTKSQQDRLIKALENLRKQHIWGDIADDDYRRERITLERQLQAISQDTTPPELPNLERAAELLNSLPSLWSHPGVTNEERENLVQEIFTEINMDGGSLVSIGPKPAYIPLFAAMMVQKSLGYCDVDSPPPPPETRASLAEAC